MSDPVEDPVGSVGSVGDEAAKLFRALSDWAGQGAGQGAGQWAGQWADPRAGGLGDHLATGAAECPYCPLCRTVHRVRQTSPEVKAQLASAASSFLEAAAALLTAMEPARPDAGGDGPRVQRIDLDPDPDPDEEPW